jgi:hypothetical protein
MSISPDEIRLSAEQKEKLVRLAEQTGRAWDQVLDEALATYRAAAEKSGANGGESFYDAAIRLGLIGCVSGGPPDLSTNPKHMEGFGESGA